MLERRRAARNYHIVAGEDDHDQEHDVELGEGVGHQEGQESGVIPASTTPNVSEELDNWDENAEDWDEEPAEAGAVGTSVEDGVESKKRSD